MNLSFPIKFNIEFILSDQVTIVQRQDGYCYQKPTPSFDGDYLTTYLKNVDFLQNTRFTDAYKAGMFSGHKIGGGGELHLEWRVHTCIWAALHAAHLEGDFVECGVNTGIFSLAVMHYLKFNELNKKFYLFDTFNGIPKEQMTKDEMSLGREADNSNYFDCYELAKSNFAPYPNAVLVKGRVPDTFKGLTINKVAYISMDMNIAEPEIAAGNFFWDKLVSGGVIVLDDYGWLQFKPQKDAWDKFAQERGVHVLNLPTGQGMIIKP